MAEALVILAGGTGNLGNRIAKALIHRQVCVRALVRRGTPPGKIQELKGFGISVVELDFHSVDDLAKACHGGTCVVSALAGLREVILGLQTNLLEAAVIAKVPRFIPSDYCIDYTKIPEGKNRNLDVRREFQQRLEQAPIAATSILNGAFTDMLTGQAPIVLFKRHRVLYWGQADQKIDFTTIDDTADFTAAAAIDPLSPRFLRIAGDQISARELVMTLNEIDIKKYRLLWAGGLGVLELMIKITKALIPPSDVLYPPWQGMQYLHNMYSGIAKHESIDNDRYVKKSWAKAKDVLSTFISVSSKSDQIR